MALISLFFKKPRKTQLLRTIGGQIAPIVLDATVKESFVTKAEPTQHPVENGADVTDHVIIKPNSLSISGIITETPFAGISDLVKATGATVGASIGAALGPFGAAAGAVVGAVGGKTLAGSLFGSSDRVLSAVAAEFVKLRDARQPIDIQTGLQLYKGYVLSSCSVSRDQKSGQSISVDLEFIELILVESQVTQVAIPKVAGALGKSNKGHQSKEGLTSDENGQGASLLKKIFGQG